MIRRLALALPIAALAACGEGKTGEMADTLRVDTTNTATVVPSGDSAAASAAAAAAPASGAMLDPNAARRDALVAAGVPAAAADAMVAARPFADMRAVDRVLATAQVDSAARRALYAKVWKPLDLNAATAEEIVLIPGVGPKMRHEFEEYRPYRDMARFRREIGKYVDSAEVARLERYVQIR
ncbi:hypothetical protein [Roseisolibacter sp. H3M3-2]|uniref:hypothetical protein n=1 Tax=Roseisolibacter sp. H3M3-2 TaxID=3031323 RepID=UPI0023DB67AF|nr:hypothetical protein [Roseisolibacter sp. H3M3-2]MDF1501690.1 hypothetical protein [Roseisolibacter sp. H3M3-2]